MSAIFQAISGHRSPSNIFPVVIRFLLRPTLVFLFAASAWAGTVSPQLAAMDPSQPVRIILQYQPSLLGAVSSLVCGALNLIELLPGGELCSTTAGSALALAQNPVVAHISVDNPVQSTGAGIPVYDYMPQTIQPQNPEAASTNMQAGQNIGVAIIDSGIHTNQDLSSGILGLVPEVSYSESFVPGEGTDDYYGHGTHVAGIIGGNGANSSGVGFLHDVHGVAPGAQLLNLKVLDRNGQSDDAAVILAIDRAIQLRFLFNIKVINLSLGRPIYESYKTDPLCQEVEKAWLAGIAVVVAAGNEGRNNSAGTNGYSTIAAPGNDPLAITVGAMNSESTPDRGDDLMTTYSSKGPTSVDHVVKPDLVAPGNKIFSILAPGATLETAESYNIVPPASYVSQPAPGETSNYFILNGTSMATAATSGAAAALLSSQNLSPDQLKARLMITATKNFPQESVITDPTTGQTFTIQYDIFTVGAGYLDLDAALASTVVVPSSQNAASPVAIVASTTPGEATPVYIVDDSTQNGVWGSSAVWGSTDTFGTAAVWGSSVWQTDSSSSGGWGSSAVWGSAAVWGSNSDSGYSAVWGSAAVWGSGTTTGTAAVWGSGLGDGDPDNGAD